MKKLVAILACIALPTAFANAQVPVDIELSLVVDVSSSVDSVEFDLQALGYAAAFSDPLVLDAIFGTGAGPIGAIAVNFIYFSGPGQQQEAVGWTYISNAAEASAFGAAIATAARPFAGWTMIGEAISFSTSTFAGNGYDGFLQVIDVSGDGPESFGFTPGAPTPSIVVTDARDAALTAGIDQINGLPIDLTPTTGVDLVKYYEDNVIGGVESFTVETNAFADIADALAEKLTREITIVPEASTYGIIGAGFLAFLVIRRRFRK